MWSQAKIILVLLAICILVPSGSDGSRLEADSLRQGQRILLFVLDAAALACPHCLDPLLEACRLLSGHADGPPAAALVLYSASGSVLNAGALKQIAARRVESLFKASGCNCDFAVLEDRVWESLVSGGRGLILFDGQARTVRRLSLPLDPVDLEKVLR